jgi:thioredoxin 1
LAAGLADPCDPGDAMLPLALSFSVIDEEISMGDVATVHLTEQTFDEALVANQSVMMVDFWAEWCGPCRAIAPVLEDLARESAGAVTLAKVNVDENPGLAARYGIRSIPTILFVKQGKVADQVIGAVPKSQLKKKLDALA